ncbi:hypothetical protein SO802_010296 [Lithocarpus litseifolius]|uniref:Uncharacterized protein n=1 Tax=Lithocarpus litseifolius TaxID=425828 RepID=A0AAW2DFA4_9ROSI
MNKGDPSVVLYHKFIISGFVSYKDWGRHPSLLKKLTGLKSLSGSKLYYSYYDYMDAFEKVLLYQNKNFDHSWLLMFDKKFFGQIPTWFPKWWEMFGPIHKDYPPLVQRTIAPVTRSQSSLDSVQIVGKSSKELKDLAQQLLLQSEGLQSQEKGSPASSEASANFDPNDPLF